MNDQLDWTRAAGRHRAGAAGRRNECDPGSAQSRSGERRPEIWPAADGHPHAERQRGASPDCDRDAAAADHHHRAHRVGSGLPARYNPSVVYGTWPYPSYPPVYYPPPVGAQIGSALLTGMAFAGGQRSSVRSGVGRAPAGDAATSTSTSTGSTTSTLTGPRSATTTGSTTLCTVTASHTATIRCGPGWRRPSGRRREPGAGTGAIPRSGRSRGDRPGHQRRRASRRDSLTGGTNRPNVAEHRTQARRNHPNLAEHRPQIGTAQRPAIQHRPNGRPQVRAVAGQRGPSGFQGVGQGSFERAAAQRGQMSRQGQIAARARAQQRAPMPHTSPRAMPHSRGMHHGGRRH